MKLIISPNAAQQLELIYDYARCESEKYAANLYHDIVDEIKQLRTFPQMAPVEPTLHDEQEIFRALIVKRRYKVIYTAETETIYIADVWDCRQNPASLRKRITQK